MSGTPAGRLRTALLTFAGVARQLRQFNTRQCSHEAIHIAQASQAGTCQESDRHVKPPPAGGLICRFHSTALSSGLQQTERVLARSVASDRAVKALWFT